MKLTHRLVRAGITVLLFMQLTACIEDLVEEDLIAEDLVEEDLAEAPTEEAAMDIQLTNPPDVEAIETPDIVINISGTASSSQGIATVKWQNDRGGNAYATGKEEWITGDIVLQLGTNVITITAEDFGGNSISETLTVERENTTLATDVEESEPTKLLFSYDDELNNGAPVKMASIRQQPVYFDVKPGDNWVEKGIQSISITCCKGESGPGEGELYTTTHRAISLPWTRQFDLSGFAVGGLRRVRVWAIHDDGTKSDGKTFDFTVIDPLPKANTAPLISGAAELTATADVQYSFRPSAQDPDGDTMQFSISSKPSWAKFSKSTGRLHGTPTSNDVGRYDNIVISVSDGQVKSSLAPFSIDVEAFGGGSATLSWSVPTERTDGTPLTNLAGYNVYYGQASGDYSNKIEVSNSGITSYMVDNLSSGPWFFVITAVDNDGLESNPSNEGNKNL